MSRRLSHGDLAAALAQAREEIVGSRREVRNLRRENEVLLEATELLIHETAARERFAFVHARHDRFGVKVLCRVLVTEHTNYFAWSAL